MTTRSKISLTITEVAEAAGVGRATAARTLGGYGSVSEASRRKVLEAAERLGYRPNALALSLRTGRTHTLGVIVAEIGNPFFAEVVNGIVEEANAAGWDPIIVGTQEILEREQTAMRILLDKQVDGIILAPAASDQHPSHVSDAMERNVPVVLIDRLLPGIDIDAVVIDNRDSARAATSALIARGHRRIGFHYGPPTETSPRTREELDAAAARMLWSSAERLRGYLEAHDLHSVDVDLDLITYAGDDDEASVAAVNELISARVGATAILATEMAATRTALTAIAQTGRSSPQDVSLIGFDDSPWAKLTSPPLTTIAQPTEEMGRAALRLLLDRLKGQSEDATVLELTSVRIERDSIRSL